MRPGSLLIKPAGPDCNLSCDYCFYDCRKALFTPGAHRLSDALLDKALREYLRLAGENAQVAFQGGEPTLMGLPFFQRAAALVTRYRARGQRVQFGLQTNGLLMDRAFAEWLAGVGALVGISLDGPPALHDLHRRRADGADTSERVLRAVRLLRACGAQFNTLSVVTRDSLDHADAIFDYLCEKGSGYLQFIPCLDDTGRFSPDPARYGEFLCRLFDRWAAVWPRVYVRNFDELLLTFCEYRSISCGFGVTCSANLVLEHDGTVYPCDFHVTPELRLGNLAEHTLAQMLEHPTLDAFVRGKAPRAQKCLQCEFLPLCQGDCPANRGSDGAARLCEGYKIFFAHAAPRLRDMKREHLPAHADAARYRALDRTPRNAVCPCGSGEKFKNCCEPFKAV